MSRQIVLHEDSREALRAGINTLADAVKVTLGAMGRNVVIERGGAAPHVTKDGYSVAKEVFLEDPIENMGAQMVKGVSAKTVEDTGDGTTTATVLAQAMINAGLDHLKENEGSNPIDIKRGMDKAVDKIVAELAEMAQQIETNEQIMQVATISANNDEEIGAIIADAMEKVTKEGTITVEASRSFDTYVDVVEGIKIHKGYLSAGFITDGEKQIAELENPIIFMTANKIESVAEIMPVLQHVPENRSLLIIGAELSGEAIGTLAINKVRGGFKLAAVKAPFLSTKMKTVLSDIAVMTGGAVLSEDNGHLFEDFTEDMFGTAEKVIIGRDYTIIKNGGGHPDVIESLRQSLRTQIKEADSKIDADDLEKRLAMLSGGVGVVYVGANSDIELQEKIDRVDDALGATSSAVEEGIVAGGGIALFNLGHKLVALEGDNEDQNVGIRIVMKALQAPIRQILKNAGLDQEIILKGISNRPTGTGFNVKTNEYVEMMDSGIIDPKKVTRVALENAVSVASLVLMTDCTITRK